MSTANIIERAAGLIIKKGKAVGSMQDEHGRLCVVGAISMVLYGRIEFALNNQAYRAIDRFLSPNYVMAWSDDTPTDEVVSTLLAIAATLRAQQAAPVEAPAKETA